MKQKLSKAELEAIMSPEGSEKSLENSMAAASARHAGETLKTVNVSDGKVDTLENLPSDVSVQGPEDAHVSETTLIRVVSNFIGDDYTLNVEPRHPKRPWKADPASVAMQIASRLDEVIPRTMEVVVRPPAEDWEILLYTFSVKGLRNQWNVDIGRLREVEKRISEEMQAYC